MDELLPETIKITFYRHAIPPSPENPVVNYLQMSNVALSLRKTCMREAVLFNILEEER